MNWYVLRTLPARVRVGIFFSPDFGTMYFHVSTKSWELQSAVDPKELECAADANGTAGISTQDHR
jgi:hypothetical protein